jgi:hypothetical protein
LRQIPENKTEREIIGWEIKIMGGNRIYKEVGYIREIIRILARCN